MREEQYEDLQRQINGLLDRIRDLETMELGTELRDYSATSTIVGITTFTQKEIDYKLITDKEVFVRFRLQGTNDGGGTFSFTLPYVAETAGGGNYINPLGRAMNDGAWVDTNGHLVLADGSTTVTLRHDAAASAWGISGDRAAFGEFIFIRE